MNTQDLKKGVFMEHNVPSWVFLESHGDDQWQMVDNIYVTWKQMTQGICTLNKDIKDKGFSNNQQMNKQTDKHT